MAIQYEWKTGYCEYLYEDPQQPAGNVKVTILHWTCSISDDNFLYSPITNIGTVDASDQNRVYTLAALQSVPESVMTGWVKQALDNQEEGTTQDIEDGLLAQWNEKLTPSGGGLTPS